MPRFTELQQNQTNSNQSVLRDYVQRLRVLPADCAHGEEMLSQQAAAIRTGAVCQRNVQRQLVEHVNDACNVSMIIIYYMGGPSAPHVILLYIRRAKPFSSCGPHSKFIFILRAEYASRVFRLLNISTLVAILAS